MLSWFRPKCPVSADAKLWIERRMAWLVEQFGWKRMLDAPVVVPSGEFFPDEYDGSSRALRAMLDRLCDYMGVDCTRVGLDFYHDPQGAASHLDLGGSASGTAGMVEQTADEPTIWLETSRLADPLRAAATFAHELGHQRLLGEQRISPEEDDHEPLSDLVTVFLGAGLLTANSVIRAVSGHGGGWEWWSVSRQGYLTAPMFGYALALFAWLRGEQRPPWARLLRPDVRSPFRKSLAYLNKTGDSTLTRRGPLRPDWQGPYPAGPADDARPDEPDEEELGAAEYPGSAPAAPAEPDVWEPSADEEREFVPQSADDYFSRAVFHVHGGDLEAALLDLDEAIRLDAEEAEFYQERGSVLAELGRPREALADGQQAVRLAPDEPESYRVRGVALFGLGDYAGAIDDLTIVINAGGRSGAAERRTAEARYWRALALAADGDPRAALADLNRAITAVPTWPNLYRARAGIYDQLLLPNRARRDRAKADSLEPLGRDEQTRQ